MPDLSAKMDQIHFRLWLCQHPAGASRITLHTVAQGGKGKANKELKRRK